MISDHHVMIRAASMETSLCPVFGHRQGLENVLQKVNVVVKERNILVTHCPCKSKETFPNFSQVIMGTKTVAKLTMQKNYKTHPKISLNLNLWTSLEHYTHYIELLQGPLEHVKQLGCLPLSRNKIIGDLCAVICTTTNICSALYYRLSSQITASSFHQQLNGFQIHLEKVVTVPIFMLFCFLP